MPAVMTRRPAATPTTRSLERVLGFMRAAHVKVVDEVQPIPAGLIVRTPSLPSVWSANQVRVTEPLKFDELVALARAQRDGLRFVDIAFEHQDSGPALERAFRAAGWKVQRDVLMSLSGGADRPADTSVVVAAGEDEVMELMVRWYSEDPGPSRMERDQLVAITRRETRIHADRLLGVRSTDGQLVAMTKLRADGPIAQVEDVYTVPEARGRGYARALVSHAIELARADGAELIFIVADDGDWPKLLYARIGFRPLGHVWHFHHA